MQKKISFFVKGYKSIRDELEVEIAPLTLLAGANSSGKSSSIQPLLILKQTIDAPYDPGSLLLNGANVRMTSSSQILSKGWRNKKKESGFSIGFCFDKNKVELSYEARENKGFALECAVYELDGNKGIEISNNVEKIKTEYGEMKVSKRRGFLFELLDEKRDVLTAASPIFSVNRQIVLLSRSIIHLPGLRGNPQRSYPTVTMESGADSYSGTFENYTASVIAYWTDSEPQKLVRLSEYLKILGLTGEVEVERKNEAEIELNVSRVMHPRKSGMSQKTQRQDMVNIADVGFGVSQVLPVLVALVAAKKDQIVYLEQPEIHLHPRAQHLLAGPIVDAANRGARVVVETHSSILLTGIQELGVKGRISPDKVAFHWFNRDENGATRAMRADLDENFAFGDWPEDFSETSFEADMAYVNAVSEKEEKA